MQPPRRVPWTSIPELDQVCSWIFSDENDLEAKRLAVRRISAWKAITSLPHALESTLALLVVILQDELPEATSFLSIRQNYAAVIIRLVNGLVDPLQSGTYARSIAAIAAQLGLPQWLVELRHAATHEDLPSLELLREAARQSMSWLLHNYWIPTINPSTTAAQSQPPPLRPLGPVLKQYKTLTKLTTRDVSMIPQFKQDTNVVMKDIERWIAEARIAVTKQALWDSSEQDMKERLALERLCDHLLEKGALVPLSKKKRVFPTDDFLPPNVSVQLWSPLLHHIQANHPQFPSVLVNRIVVYLLAPQEEADSSFDNCLARWVVWIISTFSSDDASSELKRDTAISLVVGLGPSPKPTGRRDAVGNILLKALCSDDDELDTALELLLQSSDRVSSTEWNPEHIAVMNERLNVLLASPDNEENVAPLLRPAMELEAPGWRILDERSGWRPCPIGVHCASFAT
ncbi:Las1-like-domain-containing protein [Mycena floridula]|nr:Las1-like-domain-containing protein [Mycena floridula]